MTLTFDHILSTVNVDTLAVHLVRHKDGRQGTRKSIYALWRDDRDAFELYQSIQGRPIFRVGNLVASFVATPQNETLFAGFYKVNGQKSAPVRLIDPVSNEDASGKFLYDLVRDDRLSKHVGKLTIDWGKGLRSWAQRGGRSQKPVLSIKQTVEDERFPGYLLFLDNLSGIQNIPASWRERLSEVKGVYVLTCPRTHELYVGSATGGGGFYERWCQHAVKGGDAVRFRSREPADYQVSILEVAGSAASDRDIIHAEQLWMKKLQAREMGLNGGSLTSAPEASL